LAKISLSLDELNIPAGTAQTVYVTIARYTPGCASDADSDLKRFHSTNEGAIPDVAQPDQRVDLVSLRPVIQLELEDSVSPNHAVLPILRIEKNIDNTYKQVMYMPPVLSVAAAAMDNRSRLWQRLDGLLANVRMKANQIRSQLFERRAEAVMLEAQRKRIIVLTGRLARLEAERLAECHPHDIYCSLVDYCSDLATLLEDPIAPVFPRYNHNELDATLSSILDFIESTVDGISLRYSVIAFSLTEDGNYVGLLPENYAALTVAISFQLKPGVNKDDMISWVDNAYVCAMDDFEDLLLSRHLGLNRVRVEAFDALHLKESSTEVFFEIEGISAGQREIVIASSDLNLAFAQPHGVLCLIEQST
jgi:type VI secretion system protein ImpJ